MKKYTPCTIPLKEILGNAKSYVVVKPISGCLGRGRAGSRARGGDGQRALENVQGSGVSLIWTAVRTYRWTQVRIYVSARFKHVGPELHTPALRTAQQEPPEPSGPRPWLQNKAID